MKTNCQVILISTVFSLAAMSTASCTEKTRPPEDAPPPVPPTASITPAVVVPVQHTTNPNASGEWPDLKTCNYDARVRLFAGLKLMEDHVDNQIAELNAKRTTLNELGTDLREWDFAMKEMVNSRTFLQGMDVEMHQATRDNWEQKMDKVGRAWVRTQEACAKVNASTTQ